MTADLGDVGADDKPECRDGVDRDDDGRRRRARSIATVEGSGLVRWQSFLGWKNSHNRCPSGRSLCPTSLPRWNWVVGCGFWPSRLRSKGLEFVAGSAVLGCWFPGNLWRFNCAVVCPWDSNWLLWTVVPCLSRNGIISKLFNLIWKYFQLTHGIHRQNVCIHCLARRRGMDI